MNKSFMLSVLVSFVKEFLPLKFIHAMTTKTVLSACYFSELGVEP